MYNIQVASLNQKQKKTKFEEKNEEIKAIITHKINLEANIMQNKIIMESWKH